MKKADTVNVFAFFSSENFSIVVVLLCNFNNL